MEKITDREIIQIQDSLGKLEDAVIELKVEQAKHNIITVNIGERLDKIGEQLENIHQEKNNEIKSKLNLALKLLAASVTGGGIVSFLIKVIS